MVSSSTETSWALDKLNLEDKSRSSSKESSLQSPPIVWEWILPVVKEWIVIRCVEGKSERHSIVKPWCKVLVA